MFNLEEELKKLPEKPGVYLMHDKDDHIIYVGKAVILKNRVRQYFQKSRNVSPKIARMIEHIAWFEYIVTDSELEALVLECNLIKEHNPKYNTMLKDGKSYPFLKATVSEDFPRFVFARQMKRDGAKYFGPFTSGAAIRSTIELVNKLFHLPEGVAAGYRKGASVSVPSDGPVPGSVPGNGFERGVPGKFSEGAFVPQWKYERGAARSGAENEAVRGTDAV